MEKEYIILSLYYIGAIKFGNFILKSRVESPFYIDLRLIISYPKLLNNISKLIYKEIKNLHFDNICGVPYTALPIATTISSNNNIKMIIRRKEKKQYGTKKIIEGVYKENETCLIIEDIITTGSSIIETKNELNNVGLNVNDAIVLINRSNNINNIGNINIHSIFTINEIFNFLLKEKKITLQQFNSCINFLYNKPKKNIIQLTLRERKELTQNETLKKLFTIMELKKTNVCLSADLTKCQSILDLVEQCGEHICILKTHVDIIDDFNWDFIIKLKKLSKKYNFLIFEDRKFADIGNTVMYQLNNGIYKINEWADIINCHILPGEKILEGLNHPAILLIAQMSSKNNLLTEEYTTKCIDYAKKYSNVIGFIDIENITPNNLEFIHMTPGVSFKNTNDNFGQQYKTPKTIIGEKKSDIIIVGRGIYKSKNPKEIVKKYQMVGWENFHEKIYQMNELEKIHKKKYIISFTTSPKRIHKCKEVINNLLNQTIKPDKIILNIPKVFYRTGEKYEIPNFIKDNITLNIINNDYGPATKIIPTILYLKSKNYDIENTYIIYLDDDILYNTKIIEIYDKYNKINNNNIYGFRGFNYNKLKIDRNIKDFGNMTIIEGFGSVCIKLKLFKNDFMDYMLKYTHIKMMNSRLSDDIILSNYFHKHNYLIKKIPLKIKNLIKPLEYGKESDALHKQNVNNINRYKKVIQDLKNNNELYFKL
jgi:uridine monophosphate synthetase